MACYSNAQHLARTTQHSPSELSEAGCKQSLHVLASRHCLSSLSMRQHITSL